MNAPVKSIVEQQLERCIELYGAPIDSDFPKKIDLNVYEQLRADMMIMVGIVSALLPAREGGSP